tara:strand:+ start:900 stop:1112 length:213 start_codon:yes stop_codon:yes gene_type:complete
MKIDKGIPIQKARSKTREDIDKMEVGDSIWVKTKKESEKYRHAMMRLGWSVTVRMTKEPSPNGFRIWRTK